MPTYFVSYAHTGRDGTGAGHGRMIVEAALPLTKAEHFREVELTVEITGNVKGAVLLNFQLLQETP